MPLVLVDRCNTNASDRGRQGPLDDTFSLRAVRSDDDDLLEPQLSLVKQPRGLVNREIRFKLNPRPAVVSGLRDMSVSNNS